MYDINFLVVATKHYKQFVYPYIASVLSHVPNSHVEVIVDNTEYFNTTIHEAKKIFEHRFIIRKYNDIFSGWEHNTKHFMQANTVRFLENPTIESKHVYIGDIDILVLDSDIVEKHISHAKLIGLPYSNVHRYSDDYLTGLHFIIDSAEYYKLLSNDYRFKIAEMVNQNTCPYYDERLLFHMMNDAYGVPKKAAAECTYPNAEPDLICHDYRPQHGIHMSLNRTDIAHPTKGWGISKTRLDKYNKLKTKDIWKQSESKLFSSEYKLLINKLETIVC